MAVPNQTFDPAARRALRVGKRDAYRRHHLPGDVRQRTTTGISSPHEPARRRLDGGFLDVHPDTASLSSGEQEFDVMFRTVGSWTLSPLRTTDGARRVYARERASNVGSAGETAVLVPARRLSRVLNGEDGHADRAHRQREFTVIVNIVDQYFNKTPPQTPR